MKIYRSNAKINIGLRIVGKRPDGYHELESIFQEISLCDEILIRKRPRGIKIQSSHPDLPVDEKNLCFRVFQLMAEKFRINAGVEIELIKNIPMGSGLGGGSSNAAICLEAINELYDLGLSAGQLMELGAQVGSDIPFFILGKAAFVRGRGEIVQPIRFLADYQVLIVHPEIHISTAFVYKNFELGLTKYGSDVKFEALISRVQTLGDLNRLFFNDLEEIAIRYYPELSGIRQQLEAIGARFVSLSGSGSAMYGLFPLDEDVSAVKDRVFPHFRVYVVKPVV
ncbi:MAG: 4-(cytidine 5'-diphospho)-2-C-methyl-D-erythritol kinase [Calditrichia bacterium]